MTRRRLTRRRFLGRTAAGAAAFLAVPRHVLGGPGRTPPSEIKGNAVCGLGRGRGFVSRGRTLAVCDVDTKRQASAAERAGPGCKGYTDFRRILDRKDIVEVKVATPPHWHALISIMAAQAGKNVFCEKPLSRTIGEGRALVQAIERYGCEFRYGAHTEGTPSDLLRRACHTGLLGAPLTVYQTQALGCNFKVSGWRGMVNQIPQPVPPHLDWNLYVGPAPMKPYHPHRTHGSFRGYWDYDGGGLADMGAHVLNAVIPAIGKDHTSAVEIRADAPPPHDDAVGVWYTVHLKYADGLTLVLDSGCRRQERGREAPQRHLFLEGPKGKVYRKDRREWAADPPELLDELRHAAVPRDTSQLRDLPRSLRTVTHAHRVTSVMNLANLAVRTGRTLRFDPVAEQIVGDDEANALVDPAMRAPWHL